MTNLKFHCNARVLLVLAFAGLLAWSSTAFAAARQPAAWQGVVTYVVDGDTLHVRPAAGGKPVVVRLDGIDAPEICQSGGSASRNVLRRRALGQRVAVQGRRHDDYGRLLARIVLDNKDLGQWMVARGLAWSYSYRGRAGAYALQQVSARAARRGIFAPTEMPAPLEPRAFRHQHGNCHGVPNTKR